MEGLQATASRRPHGPKAHSQDLGIRKGSFLCSFSCGMGSSNSKPNPAIGGKLLCDSSSNPDVAVALRCKPCLRSVCNGSAKYAECTVKRVSAGGDAHQTVDFRQRLSGIERPSHSAGSGRTMSVLHRRYLLTLLFPDCVARKLRPNNSLLLSSACCRRIRR